MAETTVQFKTPPPFVSTRRSRIFVTKLREISKVHVVEQQRGGESSQEPAGTAADSPSKRKQAARGGGSFRPIKAMMEWAEGHAEILTCASMPTCKRGFTGRKPQSQPHQQRRITSLHDDSNDPESLRNLIFGGGRHRSSSIVVRRRHNDCSSSADAPSFSTSMPSFADEETYTTTDEPHFFSYYSEADYYDDHDHLDSSLYTTDDDEVTFDDTTTISTWVSESRGEGSYE